jgi:hypothetical protein
MVRFRISRDNCRDALKIKAKAHCSRPLCWYFCWYRQAKRAAANFDIRDILKAVRQVEQFQLRIRNSKPLSSLHSQSTRTKSDSHRVSSSAISATSMSELRGSTPVRSQ